MKTINYLKIIVALIAMLMIATNIYSQAPPTITISTLTCQEGTISVPVTVTNFNGVGNISLKLNYNPTILTYQNVVVNPAIPAGNTITTIAPNTSGQFRLSFVGAVGNAGITLPNGSVLFTLTFSLKAGVSSITTPLTWSALQGDCDLTPPSPGVFNPVLSTTNFSTYFINGSVAIKPIPTITGPNSVCPGSTGNVYTTQAGMSNYVWNVSLGGIITAGGTVTSNTVTITWPLSAGSKSVSVNYTDPSVGCTATIPTVYTVNVASTINPTLSGSTSVCNGSTGMIYTTEPGMSNYIWSLTGGTITAGSTSNSATVTWNTPGAQSITVDYAPSGGCAHAPTTLPVTVTATVGTPTPITISAGTEPTCQSSNNITTYSTTATDNTGFNWSISNLLAGNINPTTGVMTWNNGFTGTVDIRVTANGCNGPSSQIIRTVTVSAIVGNPTAITISAGTEPTCQLANSTTSTTYTTTALNSTGFNWSISNSAAGFINPLSGVMIWTNGFSGTVDVQVTANGCNGISPQVIRTVTITPFVGTPTPIIVSAGSEPTCQINNTTTTTTYSTTATNNSGFNWSINNPVAGTINPTTGKMTWAMDFQGTVNIQVTANGCNGQSAQVIRTVTVSPTVGTPIFTKGGTSVRCPGASTIVYSATATNSSGITYSLDANSLAAGSTINSLTGAVTFTAGWNSESTITALATGCNGPTTAFHTVKLPKPTITGPNSICPGSTGIIYATEAGMNNYSWTVSTGGTITAGASTNSITVTWSLAVGAQSVTVNYTDPALGCSANTPTIYPVNIANTITPTLTGPNSVCAGTTGIIYTSDPGMSSYVWSITGGMITAGGTSNAVTVTWNNSGARTISVSYTSPGGCVSLQTVLPVNITPTVGTPTAINIFVGTEPTCQLTNAMTTTYGTTATNSTGFIWSISNPAAGIINPTTGTMLWGIGFTGSVDIQVRANGCNGPSSQVIRTVTVTPLVGTPTPITVSAGSEPTCVITNSTTTTTYSTTASNSTGLNWSISNLSAGYINPTTGVMTWALGFSGVVDIQVTANGCNGISSQTIRRLTINTPPSATIVYDETAYCQSVSIIDPVTITGTTGGTFTATPTGLSINSSTGAINPSLSTAGSYTITYTLISGGCGIVTTTTTVNVVALPSTPVVSVTQQPTCTQSTGTITITAPIGTGISYSLDGINYFTTPVFTSVVPGTYSVKAMNSTGCISSGSSVTVIIKPSTPTWTGVLNNDWNNVGNWCSNAVPTSLDNVTIPISTNDPVIGTLSGSPAVCNNLTIESGAKVTLSAGSALTINGILTNNNTAGSVGIIIQSDATGTGSLITSSTSGTGSATAQRFMTSGAWHNVSSPLSGQTVANFLTSNPNIATSTNGTTRGMMDYNPSTNTWNPFFTNASAGTLGSGKGFSMRVGATSAAVTFTGLLQAGPVTITGLTGNYWNCIGNPYSSSIGINTNSSSLANFLFGNANNLDPLYGAIYVWEQPDASNGQTGKYSVYSNVSPGLVVQQGQAYFVKMKTGVTSLSFTSAMQIHSPTLGLKSKKEPWPTINLQATVGDQKSSTIIAFNSTMTKGLDPTYDAGLLKGSSDLILYSRLVDDIGQPFAIQALPDNESGMTIPIGLDFKTGGQVVFSTELVNLPVDCKVILEDKLTKTFTDLSKYIYKTTIAANSSIPDRFRLYTSKAINSVDKGPLVNKLTAYANRNIEIRVNGKVSKNAIATLYDVYGRVILVKTLDEGNINVIPLPNIKIGIYMLSVNDNGKLNGFKILVRE